MSKRNGGGICGHLSFEVEKFVTGFRINKKREFYGLKKSVITLMMKVIEFVPCIRVNQIVFSIFFLKSLFFQFL